MTLARSHSRTRSRWSASAILLATVFLLSLMVPLTVLAAPAKITLEQCRNGASTAPNDCEALGGSIG